MSLHIGRSRRRDQSRGAGRLWPLALLLVLPCAGAQMADASEYLTRMDRDDDGRIALAEYQDWMSYAFQRMDANGDGVLTSDELPGRPEASLSLAEHRDTLAAAFQRQDHDGDGFLDAAELSAPPR